MSGTVVGVIQANPNGLLHIQRHWYLSTDGGAYVDFNRVFPGKEDGNAAQVHAYKLWNNLWAGNTDFVIDLHTQTTDAEFPLFIYADYSVKGVKQLAEAIPADIIKVDTPDTNGAEFGQNTPGAVENVFNAQNIPSITLEVGGPRVYQKNNIDRALEGIYNILKIKKIISGKVGNTSKNVNTYIGEEMIYVKATVGGYAEILVKLGDKVEKGHEVAIQRNYFGEIIMRYTVPKKGIIATVGTGATREPGSTLVYILV